jgi:hypothetical protein
LSQRTSLRSVDTERRVSEGTELVVLISDSGAASGVADGIEVIGAVEAKDCAAYIEAAVATPRSSAATSPFTTKSCNGSARFLAGVANRLEDVIGASDRKQAKALLRLLIKDLCVDGRLETLPLRLARSRTARCSGRNQTLRKPDFPSRPS